MKQKTNRVFPVRFILFSWFSRGYKPGCAVAAVFQQPIPTQHIGKTAVFQTSANFPRIMDRLPDIFFKVKLPIFIDPDF